MNSPNEDSHKNYWIRLFEAHKSIFIPPLDVSRRLHGVRGVDADAEARKVEKKVVAGLRLLLPRQIGLRCG